MDVTDHDDIPVPPRKEGQSLADYVVDTLGIPEASADEYAEREGQTDSFFRVNGLPEPPDAA